MEHMVSNNFLEIISGTSNRLHPAYLEAADELKKGSNKAMAKIKGMVSSIEGLSKKVSDPRISKSRGNIKNFSGYENINTTLSFLKKELASEPIVKQLDSIKSSLEKYQPQYTEGYEKNVRLIVLEYENSLDMLVTGLSSTIAESVDVVQSVKGMELKAKKVTKGGFINKTIEDLSAELSAKNHKQYLEDALTASKDSKKVNTNIEESVTIMESSVADTLDLIDAMFTGVRKIGGHVINISKMVVGSVFGIIPLIRSCLYIRYKKKADTILALEQQADFLEQNIERLKNRTNISESEKKQIIKKQQAQLEAYRKKAAKLRAQLADCEKAAATEIKKENPDIASGNSGGGSSTSNNNSSDDDFVLEQAGFDPSFFTNGVVLEND